MILLYMHSGAYNHGCEALVRSIIAKYPNEEFILQSFNPKEDEEFKIQNIAQVVPLGTRFCNKSIFHLLFAKAMKLLFKTEKYYWKGVNKPLKKYLKDIDYAFSIGGDNYCYTINTFLEYQNKFFYKNKIKNILFGASINKDALTKRVIKDLNRYSLITARESLTYEVLINAGLKNVVKTIDTAFFLEKQPATIQNVENDAHFIGINASPLIEACAKGSNIIFENYKYLIEWIIKNTKNYVLLIPHVTINTNNDLTILNKLCESISSNRIIVISSDRVLNCMQLKNIISKCDFTVCARTHASIASYSTAVPCLVVGYSIKSKGIAKDLFNNIDDYVVSASDIKSEQDLLNKFLPLYNRKEEIHNYLMKMIPEYLNGYFDVLAK